MVDHIQPLKRGGMDAPENMQWQTTEAAKRKDRVGVMHRVKMLAARDLVAILVTVLIIVAAAHLLVGRNFERTCAPAAPPIVIHVRRAPDQAITTLHDSDCDRVEDGVEALDAPPGWPFTAGWN